MYALQFSPPSKINDCRTVAVLPSCVGCEGFPERWRGPASSHANPLRMWNQLRRGMYCIREINSLNLGLVHQPSLHCHPSYSTLKFTLPIIVSLHLICRILSSLTTAHPHSVPLSTPSTPNIHPSLPMANHPLCSPPTGPEQAPQPHWRRGQQRPHPLTGSL